MLSIFFAAAVVLLGFAAVFGGIVFAEIDHNEAGGAVFALLVGLVCAAAGLGTMVHAASIYNGEVVCTEVAK